MGQTQVKTLADANAATTHAEKLIGQKLAKGYRETVVSAIDWPKTAEINGVAVPEPVFVNRIAPVLEPVAV